MKGILIRASHIVYLQQIVVKESFTQKIRYSGTHFNSFFMAVFLQNSAAKSFPKRIIITIIDLRLFFEI
jgi:hypothetical protein